MQKTNAGRSSEADIRSNLEKMDVMLGNTHFQEIGNDEENKMETMKPERVPRTEMKQ